MGWRPPRFVSERGAAIVARLRAQRVYPRRFAVACAVAGASSMLTAAVAWAAADLQSTALRTVGADQGVFVQAEDGTVLAELNADRAVHPASVTKIATTIALLDRLGPAHRFRTTFSADGPLMGENLDGNLVIEARGDPFFVFESAFLALAELRAIGLRRVAGSLRVEGPFTFNWQPDDGRRLLAALSGRDGANAWPAVQARRGDLAGLRLADAALDFSKRHTGRAATPRTLFVYRSPPLATIMKALNAYSNNVFHTLSATIGGPKEVERIVRERIDSGARAQVVIDNAAGAGLTNRMSPRAAAYLVQALEREADEHSLALIDLLPVAGIDSGTLRDRFADAGSRGMVVAKTGTYGDVGACALAGAVRTRKWGVVVFAILNKDVDVAVARKRQDAFVRALIAEGEGTPLAYSTPAPSPLFEAQLSAAE